MTDTRKTKAQLIEELQRLRAEVAALEQSEAKRARAEETLRESEGKYRNLVERSNDGIVIIQDDVVRYANPRLMEMWGVTAEEIIGNRLIDYIHPDEHPKLFDRYQRRVAGEHVPPVYESVLQRKDGSHYPVELNAGLITYQGKPADLVMVHDISERVQAAEALRESEEKYRTLVERSDDGIVIIQDEIVQYANPRVGEMWGGSPEEVTGTLFTNYIHPDELPKLVDHYRRRMAGEDFPSVYETVLKRKDGSDYPAELNAGLITYQGRPANLLMIRDITERKQAEEALRESEEKYRTLVERANDGIIIIQDEIILYGNPRLAEIRGGIPGETFGTRFTDYIYPDELPKVADRYRRRMAGEEVPSVYETALMRKDGSKVHVELNAGLITYQGKPANLVMVRDITERVQAEKRLRWLSRIAEQVGEGVAVTSLEGDITFVNQAWAEMHGYTTEELIGKHLSIFHNEEQLQEEVKPFNEQVVLNGQHSGEVGHVRRDGTPFPTRMTSTLLRDETGKAIGLIGSAIDITGRVQAEQHSLHLTQMLRAVRDINQLITREHDPDRLLSQACEILVQTRGYRLAWVGLIEAGHKRVIPAASAGHGMGHLGEDSITWDETKTGQGPTGKAIRTRQPCVARHIASDPHFAPWREAAQAHGFESLAAVPMVHGERVFGVLNLYSSEPDFFGDEEEVELLAELADDLAFGLQSIEDERERMRAEEVLERRNRVLQTLYEVTLDIGTQVSLEGVLRRALEQAEELLGTTSGCAVHLYDPDEDVLRLVMGTGREADFANVVLKPGEGMAGRLLQSGESLIVDDYDTWEGRAEAYTGVKWGAALGVPLRWQGQTIGALTLGSGPDRPVFTDDDIWLAEMLAAQVAVATRNAQLFDEIQRRAHDRGFLFDVTAAAVSTSDLDLALQRIAETLHLETMAANAIVIWLTDPDGARLVPRAVVGYGPETAAEMQTIPISQGILGWVAQHGQPVLVPDVTQDARYVPIYEQTRSKMALPLIFGDYVIGVLDVHSAQPNAFSEDDLELFQTMATTVATTIQNTSLFEQTQRHLESLTNLNRVSQVVTSSLNLEEVLEQIVELTGSVVRSDYTSVILPDEKGEAMTGVEDFRDVSPIAERIRSSGVTRYVLSSGQPVIADNISSEGVMSPPLHLPDGELLKANPAIVAAGIRSFAAVPIQGREGTLGILIVRSREPRTFRGQLSLLTTFANQAAAAIENARLFERTQVALDQTETLYAASERLSRAEDIDEVLDVLVEATALQRLDWVNVLFFERPLWPDRHLFDWQRPSAMTVAATWKRGGKEPPMPVGARYSYDEFPAGNDLIVREEPVIISDAAVDERLGEGTLAALEQLGVRSAATWPLEIGGQWIGFLSGQSGEALDLNEVEIRQISAMVDQATTVIQNMRLYERAQDALSLVETLYVGSERLSRAVTIEDVLNALLRTTDLGRLDRANIQFFDRPVSFDERPEGMTVAAVWERGGKEPRAPVGTRYDFSRFPAAELLNPKEPTIVGDMAADERVDESTRALFLEQLGIRGAIFWPLAVGKQWIGVLSGQSIEVLDLGEDAIRQIDALADQAATVLQKLHLFEQTQLHLESLTNFNRASQIITSSLDLQEVLEQIVELAGSVVRSEYSSVVLLDEKGEPVVGVEDFRGATPVVQRLRSGGTTRYVLDSGQPLVVDDISEDGTTRPLLRWPDGELLIVNPPIVAAGIRSYAALPIQGREGALGVLYVHSREPRAFHDQLALLSTFTNQAAVAIENARLYRRLEELARGLEKTVLERTVELRRNKERVEAILDNSPDAILLLRPNGTIEAGNLAFDKLFGYHIDEVYGKSPIDIVEPSHVRPCSAAFRTAQDEGRAMRLEIVTRRKDGTTFDADIAVAPIKGEDGVTSLVCSLRDISALKEAERMKDAFVSNVSHELRTPISSLKLYHGLLKTALPHKRDEYLATLRRETNRLERIIEDLLRLSRLDQGRVALKLAPVDLNALADQYVADRAPLAEERGLSLSLDQAPDLPPVHADEGMLGQTLSVLLTNALNYTPVGGRVVVSTWVCQREGEACTGFSVSDTGPGIPPEEQSRLFQRFFRGAAGRESGQPGTGLGLAIAKEIVTRHHGWIEVVSEGVPGEGATFSVWLPVESQLSEDSDASSIQ